MGAPLPSLAALAIRTDATGGDSDAGCGSGSGEPRSRPVAMGTLSLCTALRPTTDALHALPVLEMILAEYAWYVLNADGSNRSLQVAKNRLTDLADFVYIFCSEKRKREPQFERLMHLADTDDLDEGALRNYLDDYLKARDIARGTIPDAKTCAARCSVFAEYFERPVRYLYDWGWTHLLTAERSGRAIAAVMWEDGGAGACKLQGIVVCGFYTTLRRDDPEVPSAGSAILDKVEELANGRIVRVDPVRKATQWREKLGARAFVRLAK